MRLLSPASDAPTPSQPRHDTKKQESKTNEETSTMTTRPPTGNTAVTSSAVPTVVLDADIVSDYMAARLCTTLLGHVLFLKNQVPFPVVQLAKMPTSDNMSRAAKKRHELLNSFDTLASHLYTTFIALSTALALRGVSEKAQLEDATGLGHHHRERMVARAFFLVALGPTVGTAKSRVLVGIDGLETRVWGLQQDRARAHDDSEDGDDDSFESESDMDDGDEDGESGDEEARGGSEEEGDGASGSDSDSDASPPPSRSPSPVPSSDSDSAPSRPQCTEDQESIRAAERLLSRTLASACAEDSGQGLAAEMAPTQIHILLRAPRRFDHPSWVPRQNLCTSLDGYLADFLAVSGQAPISGDTVVKKRAKMSKVQGVWIKSRGSVAQTEASEQEELAEEDELIWWSWDGKLVGFAD